MQEKHSIADAPDRRMAYIESLKLAKASENTAIKTYNVAIGYCDNEKDRAKLNEILNDENEHDAITTDLLVKAISGDDAMNTEYFATDSVISGVIEESCIINDIRMSAKELRTHLTNNNIEDAKKSIDKINKLMEHWNTNDSDEETEIEDGGPGSGNFNHGGRPGQVGGASSSKGAKNKSNKKKKND